MRVEINVGGDLYTAMVTARAGETHWMTPGANRSADVRRRSRR